MLIKFDADAFAYETNYNAATIVSAVGSQLTVVGIVSQFGGVFASINATDPTTEYTFILSGLTSTGTTGTTVKRTTYTGGTFEIYRDSPRDAPTAAGGMPPNPPVAGAVPDRFTDGTLVLQGTLSGFSTTINQFPGGTYAGSFRADYAFTGPPGPMYNQVAGITCLLGGNWCAKGTSGGLCNIPTGYSAHPNGKWDGPSQTTEVPASTWGSIKQLYR
jgi:hypothetical protein